MNLFDKIKQQFAPEVKNSSSGISGREFLKNGSKRVMDLDVSAVRMSDKEFYSGYSYAAINNRANKTSQLAISNLETSAAQSILDKYKASEEVLEHPYLKLIRDSDSFSEYEFWYAVSTYVDLEGVYYLMAVRTVGNNGKVGNIQDFKMINPYDIRRVMNEATGEVGGYVEHKGGLIREIPKEMIIPMRKLNPFSNSDNFAMTDAAKESQFTLKQAGDFTRSALKNNMSAPGIVSTDIQLPPELFDNFVARVTNQEKGLPLFANGAGGITWDDMQVNLDNAALNDVNEMSRSQLFAVSGVSKTTMGIEESGTTRETSKTQAEKFIDDHIVPQLQLIVDALNQDYKKYYRSEYEKNKMVITINNPSKTDKEAESKNIEISDNSYLLYKSLVDDGYDREIAAKYARGEIELSELGEPTNEPVSGAVNDTVNEEVIDILGIEAAPGEASAEGSFTIDAKFTSIKPLMNGGLSMVFKTNETDRAKIAEILDFFEEEGNLTFNKNGSVEIEEAAESTPVLDDKKKDNNLNEKVINAIPVASNDIIQLEQSYLLNSIRNLEANVVKTIIEKIRKVNNQYDSEDEIISEEDKARYVTELAALLLAYYLMVLPIYGKQQVNKRSKEYGSLIFFKMTRDVRARLELNSSKAAGSHIDTIVNDILKSTNTVHQEVLGEQLITIIARESSIPLSSVELMEKVTKSLEKHDDLYKFAQREVAKGYGQDTIIKAITDKYQHISETRAKTITRTESNRVFTLSQYEADLQFLNETGLIENAYKKWHTRSDNPCEFCLELAAQEPIPFTQNFANLGDTLEATYTKASGVVATKTLNINYEPLTAGNAHVNCGCTYILVTQNDDGLWINSKGYNPYRDSDGKFSTGPGGSGGGAISDFSGKKSSEADEYIETHYGDVKYSKSEISVINAYTDEFSADISYDDINNALRNGDGGFKSEIKTMDSAIKKTELKTDTTLWRAATSKDDIKVGQVITDKAYGSSSLRERVADMFLGENLETSKKKVKYILKINAKKGQNGIWVQNTGNNSTESEFILPRNSKYKITNVKKNGNFYEMEADLL